MEDDTRFDEIEKYGRAQLSRRYRSTAGSQETVEPGLLDELEARLDQDGYVILEGVLKPEQTSAIEADIRPRFPHPRGRNNFEGFRTQRLYNVLAKTFVCDPLAEHPVILGLLDRLLLPNYLLSQLQAIDILPGEEQQPLHYDDGFYPLARPRPALGAAAIFAVDDFTVDNGSTVVVPGSHRWSQERAPTPSEAVPAVMPAGSVLFFLGTLWHGGGANRTQTPRLCVTAQYCQPYLRPQENHWLSVPPERVAAGSDHLQRMLGYSIHPPFVGMVDGKHPRRILEARTRGDSCSSVGK